MGYLSNSNDGDRWLLLHEQDLIAGAIARGITKFLQATPRSSIFGEDMYLRPLPAFRPRV